MSGCDISFRAMGSDVRLIVGAPAPGAPSAEHAVAESQAFIERFEACASRFRPDSELCALNADPRESVPASALLRDTVRAGVWAARRSGGLVDPTLLGELEAAGYLESREGVEPASLREALAFAPARRSARPSAEARWSRIEVDEAFGVVRRPPGLRFDSGGVGKGLVADLLAERLGRYSRFVVDCGGDLRVGGFEADRESFEILAEHPLTGELGRRLMLAGGAVATSGLDVRVWRRGDGRFAHHLLDPSTGQPAWTGLVGATALAGTALEAETLSKAALLLGPDGARRLLGRAGGLIVHEDGEVESIGPVDAKQRFVISVPAALVNGAVAA
jgi:thiamine biosynthesis lipoprotein